MNHEQVFGGLIQDVGSGATTRRRILARIDANPDGVPLTKLLHGLNLPSGEGRLKELRAMLAEKVIVGEVRRTGGPGRPKIYFRRSPATAADASPQPPTPAEPRPS